jgi:hypothetical protein
MSLMPSVGVEISLQKKKKKKIDTLPALSYLISFASAGLRCGLFDCGQQQREKKSQLFPTASAFARMPREGNTIWRQEAND